MYLTIKSHFTALIKEDCKAKNHARFRKRDWVDFQAKKVLRKVS